MFPALLCLGLCAAQVRRSSQAVRDGAWTSDALIMRWRTWQAAHSAWRPDQCDGYRPIAVDITAFWRPQLQNWWGKFFNHLAQRAVKAIGFALVVEVGHNGAQRLPLLKHLILLRMTRSVRANSRPRCCTRLARVRGPARWSCMMRVPRFADMQTAHMPRFVVRWDYNCTARRNQLPTQHAGRGRPLAYGAQVCPLARSYKWAQLAGHDRRCDDAVHLSGPHHHRPRVAGCRAQRSEGGDGQATFTIWVYADPLYQAPFVLGTNLTASPATIFQLYLDRWPVEEVPLVCKQLLGLQRQFVFADLARFRLPELGLIAANILAHLVADLPPSPPASGIANRGARPAACGACWGRLVFRPHTPWLAEFAKTGRDGPFTQGSCRPSPP